ncbi:MAG: glycosyl hydrolase, partial [Ginsengibacter sp.]
MKKFFLFSVSLLATAVFAQNNKSFPTAGKKVIVYTTADSTDYRLSQTATVTFKHMGQPFETQVCVFVDPTKTFQTILG